MIFKTIKELRNQVKGLECDLVNMRGQKECYFNKLTETSRELINKDQLHARELEKKDAEIEKLKREIDILYKHFELDSEPSQEIKTAVRIDKRVHDLELENIELKSELRRMRENESNRLRSNIDRAYYNADMRSIMQLPLYIR